MNCIIPEQPLTEAEKKKREKAGIRSNDKRFHYADRLFCLSLHENAGFGRDRILEVSHAGYEIGRWYIDRHSDDGEKESEYAVTSYYALARDLRGWGWNPEIELWSDSIFDSFPADENSARIRKMRQTRVGYAKGIGFYVRQQMCMAAVCLHTHLGWAGIRLNRALHPARDGYLAFMKQYIRCSREGDRQMQAMYEEVRQRYNAMGIFAKVYD